MAHLKEKNKQKLSFKKDLMSDILDKDLKTAVLRMVKELKEDMRKENNV